MPYKDKRAEVKCRKVNMLKVRWDMFDLAKKKAELELGFMSTGGFLEIILVNYLQAKQTEDEYRLKAKNNSSSPPKTKTT